MSNVKVKNEKRKSKTIMVYGSSLSGPRFFNHALQRADVTITTNAGIYDFLGHQNRQLRPDYYWLSDSEACSLYHRYMLTAQSMGTKVVTDERNEYGLKVRGLQAADMKISLDDRGDVCPKFQRNKYIHPRLSGLICLQLALNLGATEVLLVGMEGYRSNKTQTVVETFDGREGKAACEGHTRNWIQPFITSAIETCPDVQFTFYGKLRYQIPGRANIAVYNPPKPADCMAA